MESSSKGQEERRILEEQIKSITENIESEGKAYTELTARLKYLEDRYVVVRHSCVVMRINDGKHRKVKLPL